MYIGIDLGGTKILAALADPKGKILSKLSVKTVRSENPEDVLKQLAEILEVLSKKAGQQKIKGVGMGIPGQIDQQGRVFNMPNLPALVGVKLPARLQKIKKYKYVLENDANTSALAELKYGAGKKLSNFIYVTISTGIGGGIVLNRKLYKGANSAAGEVGHMIIVAGGPSCGCGNKGCWEAVASGTALVNMAKAKILSGFKSQISELAGGDLNKISGEIIVEAAKQYDPVALELLDVNGYYNALGITNLVNLFDPEAVIIGGGLSYSGNYFFGPLNKCLKMFCLLNPRHKVNILRAGCKKDVGLLGALSLVVPD